jgi:hypothetical protein
MTDEQRMIFELTVEYLRYLAAVQEQKTATQIRSDVGTLLLGDRKPAPHKTVGVP